MLGVTKGLEELILVVSVAFAYQLTVFALVADNDTEPVVHLFPFTTAGPAGFNTLMRLVDVFILLPKLLVAVSFTVYVPLVRYFLVGFLKVEVVASPNSHNQEVAPPVDLSVNVINPEQVLVSLAVKLAVGAVVGIIQLQLMANPESTTPGSVTSLMVIDDPVEVIDAGRVFPVNVPKIGLPVFAPSYT